MSEYTDEQAPFGYVGEDGHYHDRQPEQAAQAAFDTAVRESRRRILVDQEARRQIAAEEIGRAHV